MSLKTQILLYIISSGALAAIKGQICQDALFAQCNLSDQTAANKSRVSALITK